MTQQQQQHQQLKSSISLYYLDKDVETENSTAQRLCVFQQQKSNFHLVRMSGQFDNFSIQRITLASMIAVKWKQCTRSLLLSHLLNEIWGWRTLFQFMSTTHSVVRPTVGSFVSYSSTNTMKSPSIQMYTFKNWVMFSWRHSATYVLTDQITSDNSIRSSHCWDDTDEILCTHCDALIVPVIFCFSEKQKT